jgi:formylglycine-generating enzyme required for sulfatase activity
MLLEQLNSLSALPRFLETGATSMPSSLEAALDKSMIRGGSFREDRFRSRCAYRSWAAPMHRSDDTGFRLCYEPI